MGLRQAVVATLRGAQRRGGGGAARRLASVRAASSSQQQQHVISASFAARRVAIAPALTTAVAPSAFHRYRNHLTNPRPASSFASSAAGAEAAAAAATDTNTDAVESAKALAAEQGLVVRAIKEAKKAGDASKADVDAAVAKLLELKAAAEVGGGTSSRGQLRPIAWKHPVSNP